MAASTEDLEIGNKTNVQLERCLSLRCKMEMFRFAQTRQPFPQRLLGLIGLGSGFPGQGEPDGSQVKRTLLYSELSLS